MKRRILLSVLAALAILLTAPSFAQKFEAVHAINFDDYSQANRALESMMEDDAMKDSRITLYSQEFGQRVASHIIVEDFDSYADYASSTEKRLASHGWTRYQLESMGSEYLGSDQIMVVDDHGAPRYTAEYLVAYLIHSTDGALYRSAIADLNKGVGNPGVLRLVAMRTGSMAYTHAVLIGGPDFESVQKYLDKLFASDTFAEFAKKVGDTRKVVGVNTYSRVATYGD
jgi:hypothetical protein